MQNKHKLQKKKLDGLKTQIRYQQQTLVQTEQKFLKLQSEYASQPVFASPQTSRAEPSMEYFGSQAKTRHSVSTMKDTRGAREWQKSGLYKTQRIGEEETQVKRASSIPPSPRASLQSGVVKGTGTVSSSGQQYLGITKQQTQPNSEVKTGTYDLRPTVDYSNKYTLQCTDSSRKLMQSTQADSQVFDIAKDILMMSPFLNSTTVPGSPLRSSKVSKFVVNAQPMTQKKKTKKKKATKAAPAGAPVYGSRITNKYELRDDVEIKPLRVLSPTRRINNITNPKEPVYPSKKMVKPKQVIKDTAWDRFLDGTPGKFEIKDPKPALGACSLAYLRKSDQRKTGGLYTKNMKRKIIKHTDSIQHLIKGQGPTASYHKAQAKTHFQRMQSAREFDGQHGQDVKELFDGGMGTALPEQHDVGVINSRLGKLAGKGTQKYSNRLRDKQLHNGTLDLFAQDEKEKHSNFLANFDNKYKHRLLAVQAPMRSNSQRPNTTFALAPRGDIISDYASEEANGSRNSSISSVRDVAGSFGRRTLLNKVAPNGGEQIINSGARHRSTSGSRERYNFHMRGNLELA